MIQGLIGRKLGMTQIFDEGGVVHPVTVVDRWSFGSAKVIMRDRANGCWLAGADPRRVAYALAY